jgi:hypothetical protein
VVLVLVPPVAAAWSLRVFWGERGCYWQHTGNGANFEASGRFGDSTAACPGFWLPIYLRPYGALMRCWDSEQRAWRGQGAAVA